MSPGFIAELDGQGEGKVTFAGARHTGEGMHCSNCHVEPEMVPAEPPAGLPAE